MPNRKMLGLYTIWDSENADRLYIGSSVDIKRRIYQHWYQLKNNKHGNAKLQNFVNKYGIDRLDHCVLSTYDNIETKELRIKELNLIVECDSIKTGFNISNITEGATCSEEGLKRISLKAKERQSSLEYKEKLSIKYSGSNSITSKLSKEDVEYIKQNAKFVKSRYMNVTELSKKFNVNAATIYRVLHNKTYKR